MYNDCGGYILFSKVNVNFLDKEEYTHICFICVQPSAGTASAPANVINIVMFLYLNPPLINALAIMKLG